MVKHQEFKNFAEELIPSFYDFFLQKALLKIVLGHNIFKCFTDFQNL